MKFLAPDRPQALQIDWCRIWRRAGGFRTAADQRLGSRERGRKEDSGKQKIFRGRCLKELFRSEIEFAFEGGGVR